MYNHRLVLLDQRDISTCQAVYEAADVESRHNRHVELQYLIFAKSSDGRYAVGQNERAKRADESAVLG